MRILDWRSGLPVSYAGGVEQDPEGFLWVGTSGGTFRYDGSEMVPKLPVGERQLVPGAATAGTFETFRLADDGRTVLRFDGTPIAGPDGEPAHGEWAHVTPDGALWILLPHAVQRRDKNGTWSPPFVLPDGETRLVGASSGRNGSLLLPCRDGVYRVEADGRVTRLARLRGVLGVLDRADGSTAMGTFVSGGGYVYEVRDGVLREIDRFPTRFMALAERRNALWIAYDTTLVRLAAGEPRETITNTDGLPSGGAMIVDREGSLWVATFRGLVQFPEPDTFSWDTEARGLGRHVALENGVVWMSTWGGLFHTGEDVPWTLTRARNAHIGAPCFDASGGLWTAVLNEISWSPRTGPRRLLPAPDLWDNERCAATPDGGLWFPTGVGLYRIRPGQGTAQRVAPGSYRAVHEDAHRTVWASVDGRTCRAPAEALERGRASWDCVPAPNREPTDFLEVDSGALWAGTFDAGVWRLRDDRWEEIPGSRELPSRWTSSLSPSPRGGVWIGGEGNFLRVRERPDLAAGWEVLERVGLWQGIPTSGIQDVAEAADGTLWVSSNLSLLRIPPQARAARPQPPPVVLVEAAVDGRRLTLQRDRMVRLPNRSDPLELRFAALSYRDPSLIRYRSRLNPDEPWSVPTKQPFFRFVDLQPRRYRVEVEATLDGERWSASPPAVVFEVLPPWYGSWWFRGLVVALLAAVLVLAYRLRVASLLKLERQRMRIAMDLHDEVGSGLGSIGVLAGLVARPDLPEAQRTDLSGRITGVSRELSQSLGDIVWSLRSGSGNLDALWDRILDRGRPLFANGNPALRVFAPDPVPSMPLSLVVRRNVSLIAIEALHNAARHAAASNVSLTLSVEDGSWVIAVADDGHGMQPEMGDSTRRGLGLEAMRLRAEEMGGTVLWQTPDGGGTMVIIRFRAGRD